MVGRGQLEYVTPIESTVVNADPVAVLRGSKHDELAKRFIESLLSTEGQEVLCRKVGEPNGPRRFELLRPPIRRDMYDERLGVSKKDNLFESAQPLPVGTPSDNDVLRTVLHARVIDSHDELVRAWSAIIRVADETKKARMLALFHELPFTQDELMAAGKKWSTDRVAATNDRIAWTNFFLDRYECVGNFRE